MVLAVTKKCARRALALITRVRLCRIQKCPGSVPTTAPQQIIQVSKRDDDLYSQCTVDKKKDIHDVATLYLYKHL